MSFTHRFRAHCAAVGLVCASGLIAGQAWAQDYAESSVGCGAYSTIAGAPGAVMLATVSACDDCTELVTLPFTFDWFGDTPITQVQVASNGQINVDSADASANCCSPDPVEVGGS